VSENIEMFEDPERNRKKTDNSLVKRKRAKGE
jgi:hypothetical protein